MYTEADLIVAFRGNSWNLEMRIWSLNCVIKVAMDSVLLNHSPNDRKKANTESLYNVNKMFKKKEEKLLRDQQLWHTGLVAPCHMGSFWIRDQS